MQAKTRWQNAATKARLGARFGLIGSSSSDVSGSASVPPEEHPVCVIEVADNDIAPTPHDEIERFGGDSDRIVYAQLDHSPTTPSSG